jgi:hypothetical protein
MVARGDIAGAVAYYQLHTGRERIPQALQALQHVFTTARSRSPGQCRAVARTLAEGFKFLGGQPEYLRVSSTGGEMLSWQGRQLVSDNNFHVVVRHGGRLYDAFTGAAGMLEQQYRVAMQYLGELTLVVVNAP